MSSCETHHRLRILHALDESTRSKPSNEAERGRDIRKDKNMLVGVPKEIKSDEYRVAILPVGVEELSQAGHRVLLETGAGIGSGITDSQ